MAVTASTPSRAVVWHDLECGSYRADMPLWLELARSCPEGAILDVGAGTGRVALALARAGRRVIALDSDAELLAALRARAVDLDIATICADARSFDLDIATTVRADARAFDLAGHEPISLCLVPMQTVQLLGGTDGRLAFLRRARAHIRPGGLIACALVTEVEPFDCADGDPPLVPEAAVFGGRRYLSQPTRVALGARTIAIERERRIEGSLAVEGSSAVEHDLIELDRVSAEDLEREGHASGLHPEPPCHIPPTDDHSGSTVVMLRV